MCVGNIYKSILSAEWCWIFFLWTKSNYLFASSSFSNVVISQFLTYQVPRTLTWNLKFANSSVKMISQINFWGGSGKSSKCIPIQLSLAPHCDQPSAELHVSARPAQSKILNLARTVAKRWGETGRGKYSRLSRPKIIWGTFIDAVHFFCFTIHFWQREFYIDPHPNNEFWDIQSPNSRYIHDACWYIDTYIHTLHYITLHYITLHCIALHYITYMHTYIHIYEVFIRICTYIWTQTHTHTLLIWRKCIALNWNFMMATKLMPWGFLGQNPARTSTDCFRF